MHCLTVAYEGATPVWHRRGGGDPLPPFTTVAANQEDCIILRDVSDELYLSWVTIKG